MDLYDNKKFLPMLLSEIDKPFNDKNFIFELKFDGTRTLLFVDPNNIYITNRRHNIITNTYPELHSIKDIVKHKVIFDGEIILMVDGKPSFAKLQERALIKDPIRINYFKKNFPVTFVCYDILYDNEDITSLSLKERKEILAKYPDTDIFVKTKYVLEEGIDLFKAVQKQNMEGIVAKNIDSKYIPGIRSNDWIKIKNWHTEVFYICGYKEVEKGSMASIIVGQLKDNNYYYVGRVTIGKSNEDFKRLKELKEKKDYLLEFIHKDDNYIMVEPKLKCLIEFLEKTKSGKLRQPIYRELKEN